MEEKKRRASLGSTVYGMYCPEIGLVRCWQEQDGEFKQVSKPPAVKLPLKIEPALIKPKPIKLIKGGRGSAKSESVAAILTSRVKDKESKLGCFREYQNSISDSVHSLISKKISESGFLGFDVQDAKIVHDKGGSVKYRGLARNPEGMKSMDGFDDFWGEEAQTFSAKSIDLMEPTLRKDGGEIWYTLNPGSSADPISQEHLMPYQDALLKHGFYEDENIMIIEMNYSDNPWFPENLEKKRVKNKQAWPSAKYEHVWEGAFNDDVEDALIDADWFDACVDAHKKLGFVGKGAIFAAHDPSDLGPDDKGLAIRHGSVVMHVFDKEDGNVNEGCDWATGLAIKHNCDHFTWDGDGMGVALGRQIANTFSGKKVTVTMFRGSEGPDYPDAAYSHTEDHAIFGQKTNKDSFKNKRAQYYQELRDRCYRTYEAVVLGKYHDPDTLISFDSSIPLIAKLRSEVCRMPVKPNANGLIQLYTKEEMKAKFNLPSPNLADSVMMLMRNVVKVNKNPVMPKTIRPMGRR